ncbi:hypothetical protein L2E82_34158 [Cichorium intybus]|uniref:Uncharacterized protein n=1 Tax=Cichorium intybus TaxID=13427 RepID=A0ACB9BLP9_CICIN|nr:hypothetical protein L2E82_34158 [Cichorium intybus]
MAHMAYDKAYMYFVPENLIKVEETLLLLTCKKGVEKLQRTQRDGGGYIWIWKMEECGLWRWRRRLQSKTLEEINNFRYGLES